MSAPAIWTVPLPDTGSCRAPDSSSPVGHNQGTTHGCADDRGVVRTANTRRQHDQREMEEHDALR